MSTSAQTPDSKPAAPSPPADGSPAVSQPMSCVPGYVVPPGAVYSTPSPVIGPGMPLSPQLSPLLVPGVPPPGTDPVAYQMYLQQIYQMQAAAQMLYYQQVLAAQQAQMASTLSPSTSPGLGPVGSDGPVVRKRSKRQQSSDAAAVPERAETHDAPNAPANNVAADVAAPPPPGRREPHPVLRDVLQLVIFSVFLLTLYSGRETRSVESYIPFIVLGIVILYKLLSLCVCRRQEGTSEAHPDAAVLNRPTHSVVQPPPGLVFDVFAAVLHFFLSINPSWEAPPKVVDDAAEAEAALAAAEHHEHQE